MNFTTTSSMPFIKSPLKIISTSSLSPEHSNIKSSKVQLRNSIKNKMKKIDLKITAIKN